MPDPDTSWIAAAEALLAAGDLAAADAAFLDGLSAARAADALHGLGVARLERDAPAEALSLLQAAEVLQPSERISHNMAVALLRLGRVNEAMARERALIETHPGYVAPYVGLAEILAGSGHVDGAADVWALLCDRALRSRNHDVITRAIDGLAGIGRAPSNWSWLATWLRIHGFPDDAERVASLRIAAAPDDIGAKLMRAMARLTVVHRSDEEIVERRGKYATNLAELDLLTSVSDPSLLAGAAIEIGRAKPFFLSYQGQDDTALQRTYGRIVDRISRAAGNGPAPMPAAPAPKIKVGFATTWFTLHSVSKLFAGWIHKLDRRRFEVYAYNFSGGEDHISREIETVVDGYRSGQRAPQLWREAIIADGLHAIIHLEVGMGMENVALGCQRLAPVQCMTWGHPVTSGFPEMDYFLSSELMEPENAVMHYTEKLVRLPNLSIFYEPMPYKPGAFTRADQRLADDAVVYVCCQSLFKYLPKYDHVFVDIARRVPAAQFLFIGDPHSPATPVFLERLVRAFAAAGLKAERHIVVVPPVTQEAFASLIALGDVYLDSIGWSGGNTTLEAIACDLPIVTMPTALMRGRHSAAILKRIGMDDWIAETPEGYVELAVRLADPLERMAATSYIAAGQERLYRDMAPVKALEVFLEAAVQKAYGTGLRAAG
ncbi:O-linked N-acetylglucosamine transferase, SPINDLY family protein [Chthonobacter albigriseus]|uniref:O-linked N-acetylglucosamine transferase, SPINDLY family protein n=1 Tax=Chthonobacter albigriseus TaxID=1683161 RepID=UPI0015EE3FE0|nr:O-linked N-acetylglucosamine transferase, SPINDLY family protein [Chthonobacter albigriseus]